MEPFFCPSTRKKLPGKHGQQDLIAALRAARANHLSPSNIDVFQSGTAFALTPLRTAAWESSALRRFRKTAWEGSARIIQGRTTDGEYASHRTFAASHAGTATRCRCQQRRERQYRRIQVRQLAVRGIPQIGRARRQFRRPRPQRQLRPGPRHLPRFLARPQPSRPRTRSTSPSTAQASWWCRPQPASATPATAACR